MIDNIMDSELYRQLCECQKQELGENDTSVSAKILDVEGNVKQILSQVPRYLPEFTSHNIMHCYNILECIDQILPSGVKLNLLELYLLIQAVLLHDIGMAPESSRIEEIKLSKDFEKFKESKCFSEDAAIGEYIRTFHVQESERITTNKFSEKLRIFDTDVSKIINCIIDSHGISTKTMLEQSDRYLRDKLIQHYHVDIGYLSILLRLGDILDFDNTRTPTVLYEHINPKNEISKLEWQKHMAVTGHIFSSQCIRFDIDSENIFMHHYVKKFVDYIGNEIYESKQYLIKSNVNIQYYNLELSDRIELNITPINYIYNDYRLEADYNNVINLLAGKKIYSTENAFLREVLQNAIDACRLRMYEMKSRGEYYTPYVRVNYETSNSRLTIIDNGCGIDSEIFANYILKVGKSYFREKNLELCDEGVLLTNQFGIGMLSYFMVSKTIEIKSKRYTESYNSNPVHFVLNLDNPYVNQFKCNKSDIGTEISLKLNEKYALKMKDNLSKLVSELLLDTGINITVCIDSKLVSINDSIDLALSKYKYVSGIITYEIKDIPGINGYLIFNNSLVNSYLHTTIAYDGFVIQHVKNESWIKFSNRCAVIINITSPWKLNLNIARDNFVQDEQYDELQRKLFYLLCQAIDKYSLPNNKFISNDFYRKKVYMDEYRYICMHTELEVLKNKEWTSVTLWKLLKYCETEQKKITFVDLNKELELVRQISIELSSTSVIVKRDILDGLIYMLEPFGNRYYYISEINKSVVEQLDLNYTKIRETNDTDIIRFNENKKNLVQNAMSKKELLLIVQDMGLLNMIVYNNENSLVKILDQYEDTLAVKKLVKLIEDNIKFSIYRKEELKELTQVKEIDELIETMSGRLMCVDGFICKDSFIDSFNIYLKNSFYPELQNEDKSFSSENIVYISDKSFPYWYYKSFTIK